MATFTNIFKMVQQRSASSSAEQKTDRNRGCRLLNFHMDTRWCYDQESIIDVSPLALPVENIDAEENCERYGVNELPTILLVGPDGREIHRWTDITPSEFINSYLVERGLVPEQDVPPCRGELKEVKDHRFADGSTYTGSALCYGDSVVPEGMGVRKFDDHNDLGHFHSFILEGVCYRNHHQYMYAGISKWGDLNGWGMHIKDGEFFFGIYRDDSLVVNLTPLVRNYWGHVQELTVDYKKSLVKVQKNPETVFVGCPQMTWNGRFGITFRQEGDVFVGQSNLGVGRELTGYYLHFSPDGKITKGYFIRGILECVFEDVEFETRYKEILTLEQFKKRIGTEGLRSISAKFIMGENDCYRLTGVDEPKERYLIIDDKTNVVAECSWDVSEDIIKGGEHPDFYIGVEAILDDDGEETEKYRMIYPAEHDYGVSGKCFESYVNVWPTHEYIDFDIDMCYDPSRFDISRNYLYGIVEMGETDNDIIVKANPFRRGGGGRLLVTDWEDETTRWFAFPRKDSIRQKLMEIQRRDGSWAPLMKDYRVDFVNNIQGAGTDHLVVYRHRSCWENDTRYVFNRKDVDRSEMEYYKDPEDRYDDELPF